MCKPHEIFKLLGVSTRLKIIKLLKKHGHLGVNELSEKLDITPSAVSQHLKAMKELNLVKNHRDGYRIPYSLNLNMLNSCREMMDSVCECDCHSHNHNGKDKKMNKISDIKKLKRYKKKLQSKIKKIEDRIKKLEKKKEV
ncbi:MAG: winged helix-turn-helix transcriptional regulator [Candidatus Mcinerneyibacterium aminivorans]|uniref:Winged helix-turn-helix transcriptional regulator n=1 Tax=Candidatus Mcinerneyibacterium aminivorans TaxID=2703815 RepID=A0A5D0MIA5_9BACT|nr:MAG: winged helix-turn-helix transcriptional regulator [Candidatus Mcinerneyibacterium aminivorans]